MPCLCRPSRRAPRRENSNSPPLMLADLRFVLRTLARNRAFTLVTVLTLALGIGSAASIFSVTDWILFRATKFSPSLFLIGGKSEQGAVLPIRFDFMARA